MAERFEGKIEEIRRFLSELEEYTPLEFEDYLNQPKDRAACERLFEKIIEAIVNIGFMLVKLEKLEIPETDKDVFISLEKKGIISPTLSKKLRGAKGMRNILAHEYGEINDELVYYAISKEIIPDTEEFLNQIQKAL